MDYTYKTIKWAVDTSLNQKTDLNSMWFKADLPLKYIKQDGRLKLSLPL